MMPRSVLAIDEVHKCLYSGTQRTGAALELARTAAECIAFTGTPVLNAGSGKLLIPYMELIVPFFVNPKNFIVAANAMVAYKVDTGVGRKETLLDPWALRTVLQGKRKCTSEAAESTGGGDEGQGQGERQGKDGGTQHAKEQVVLAQRREHDLLLFGGEGRSGGDLGAAVKVCYDVCTPVMVQHTLKRLSEGVLLVANTKDHQKQLASLIVQALSRGGETASAGGAAVGAAGGAVGAVAGAASTAASTAAAMGWRLSQEGPVEIFCMSNTADGYPCGSGNGDVRVTVRPDIHLTNAAVENGE
jgi:hypothetical protein